MKESSLLENMQLRCNERPPWVIWSGSGESQVEIRISVFAGAHVQTWSNIVSYGIQIKGGHGGLEEWAGFGARHSKQNVFGDVGARCQLSEDSRVTCFWNIFGYFWYFKEACSGGILCPICQCCCLSPSTFFEFPNLLFHRDSKTFKRRDMAGWSVVLAYAPRMKLSLLAFLQLKHLQASEFLKKARLFNGEFFGVDRQRWQDTIMICLPLGSSIYVQMRLRWAKIHVSDGRPWLNLLVSLPRRKFWRDSFRMG